jgi:hypothetical protein
MSWRRGFFRLWIVASIAWVAFWVWRTPLTCFYGSYPWCGYYVLSLPHPFDYLKIYGTVFGVPLATLAAGAGFGWALTGFRRRSTPN